MLVYRGTHVREKKPRPRGFGGVFFAYSEYGASNYGPYIALYNIGPQKLLELQEDRETFEQFVLAYKGTADEDTLIDLILNPDKGWIKLLKKHGYTGFDTGDEIFVFDVRKVKHVENIR